MSGPNFSSYLNKHSVIYSFTTRREKSKILELGSAIFAARHPEIPIFNLKLIEMPRNPAVFLFACTILPSGVASVHSCLCEGSSELRPPRLWCPQRRPVIQSDFLEKLFVKYYAALAAREARQKLEGRLMAVAKMEIEDQREEEDVVKVQSEIDELDDAWEDEEWI